MIDRFLAWLFRDTDAAKDDARRRAFMDAATLIRHTTWEMSHDGKAMVTILNELLEMVAARMDEEARR